MMTKFTQYDLDNAPDASKPLLENSIRGFGSIPGLHAVMAESPQLLEGYQVLHRLFQETSFDKEELTVVWQTINIEHACHYCVPAHALIADVMQVDPEITRALREKTPLASDKLNVLRDTTLELVRERGRLSPAQAQAFFAAGYSEKQILEIILGLAQKVMSNYTNHVADTPVDERFQAYV